MYGFVFVICLFASMVGAVCGIGGGIIIKPLLDALGILSVTQINFLSGCTVLSMTAYSVVKSRMNGESHIRTETSLPLVIGAVFGGIAGKQMFAWISAKNNEENLVGVIQAICLLGVTAGTLVYIIFQSRIKTIQVNNCTGCVLIGTVLGILSSFLGIGGGPVNLVMLYYFFSMETKVAVENSLYIIFFSQMANLMLYFLTGSIPDFSYSLLLLMILGGICGGVCGMKWNKGMQGRTVEKLLIGLMMSMIALNLYNLYKFSSI